MGVVSYIDNYNLLFKFIETYRHSGFKEIDPDSPLMQELEDMMEANNQFLYIGDLIKIKILYTSKRSAQMIGVKPEDLSPYHFMEAVHPVDTKRLTRGRCKVIKMGQDLFVAGKGNCLLSTNYKFRTPSGEYSDFLVQCYFYYTEVPYKTVYLLKIHTNIDWHKKIKHGFHYYLGNDLSYFRYPDDEMLSKGNVFSSHEFEIIKLIKSGLSSDEICDKLYLSVHSINTHRRNILEKSGHESISELIYELIERGVL